MYPADRKYTRDHEWIRVEGAQARVGITDYAQKQLGDVVYLELPDVGRTLKKGEVFGTIESVKAVSELYSPVGGEVAEVNSALAERPEGVNADPHDAWMISIRLTGSPDQDDLLDAARHRPTRRQLKRTVFICAEQPGTTVVAIGGTHGDEYEGPVGLKNLIQALDPASLVAGRLIVIPVLNVPAFQAGERASPLDGGNMNRVFPGDANGTITQRIARFVTDEVLARSDVVLDIHSGGKGFEIARYWNNDVLQQPTAVREDIFARLTREP
jgi:glycine cleavage system H protein